MISISFESLQTARRNDIKIIHNLFLKSACILWFHLVCFHGINLPCVGISSRNLGIPFIRYMPGIETLRSRKQTFRGAVTPLNIMIYVPLYADHKFLSANNFINHLSVQKISACHRMKTGSFVMLANHKRLPRLNSIHAP